jgi:phenylalanyl-tRNA synthetase alpha chain
MQKELSQLSKKALNAVASCSQFEELKELKVEYLGKKGALTSVLRGMGALPADERPKVGAQVNEVKKELESAIESRLMQLSDVELQSKLNAEAVDVTMPTAPSPFGGIHPITLVTDRIRSVFHGLGYSVAEGPEIETDYYNFSALNFPADHPARDMQDTFFVEGDFVLRTHTSPVQIRAMENRQPPIKIIVPGMVYRHDSDTSHSPVFHQVEGLAVGEDITLADLKGTLTYFIEQIFGDSVPVRFRPSFFPFTEPSLEVDIGWPDSSGKITWMEILGAGMVDPAVFESVGYDPEKVQGFAFGMGVERIAMLLYGIKDIRLFYEGSVRFLEQFA